MKKAFTLAEILIVLVIIGVLTAILLPVAFQAAPDENVMKFKKANSTLTTVIRELVSSDRYYVNGDLGTKSSSTDAKGKLLEAKDENFTYFCDTISEIMSYKSKKCSKLEGAEGYIEVGSSEEATTYKKPSEAKVLLDTYCANQAATIGEEIVTSDGVAWFQTSPRTTFGKYLDEGVRQFSNPDAAVTYPDENGFDRMYKVFCIDVDGIGKGEAPFGYGIRSDGKLLTGQRADEWVQKSIQKSND